MINYYSVLGISADADAARVRSAYLRLIKQVHPDLPSAPATQAAQRARDLNEAYWVLKNDGRRRAYDSRLRRASWESASRKLAPLSGDTIPVRHRPAQRRFWPTALILLPALAVASGLVLGSVLQMQRKPFSWPPQSAALAESHQITAEPSIWVDPVMIERAVENAFDFAAEAGGDAMLRYSRNCFAQLGTDPSALRAQHCIAFDLSAASILAAQKSAVRTAFTASQLRRKHLAALHAVAMEEADRENWLRAISEATISQTAQHAARSGPAVLSSR